MAEKTLKIKLLKPTNVDGRATKAGKEVDLGEAEAKNLIRRGRAEVAKAGAASK